MIVDSGPSRATVASMSSGSSSMPRASETSPRNVRTVLVTRTGNSWRPSRATASQSSVTALSWLIIDPCPARPVAVSFIQAMPFSAVSMR